MWGGLSGRGGLTDRLLRAFADRDKLEAMPAIHSYAEVADPAALRKAALGAALAMGAYLLLMATSFRPGMMTALASGLGMAVFFGLIAADVTIAATRWIAAYMVLVRLTIVVSMVAISLAHEELFTPQMLVSMVETIMWIGFLVTWLTGQAGPIRRGAAVALLGVAVWLAVYARMLIHDVRAAGHLAVQLRAAFLALNAAVTIVFLWILAKGPDVSASSPLSGPVPPPLPGGFSGAA